MKLQSLVTLGIVLCRSVGESCWPTHLLRGAFKSVLMVQMEPLLAMRPKAASKVSMNFTSGNGLGLLLLHSK